MSRIVALAVAVLALAAAGLTTATTAGAEDEAAIYQRYADVRERLLACHLESKDGWDTQTDEHRADCRALARYYVLYGWTGEGYVLHVHCRSPKHCLATPSSEPPADQPMPAGSTVYDIKVARTAVHKHKKKKHRRHKHHRSAAR